MGEKTWMQEKRRHSKCLPRFSPPVSMSLSPNTAIQVLYMRQGFESNDTDVKQTPFIIHSNWDELLLISITPFYSVLLSYHRSLMNNNQYDQECGAYGGYCLL